MDTREMPELFKVGRVTLYRPNIFISGLKYISWQKRANEHPGERHGHACRFFTRALLMLVRTMNLLCHINLEFGRKGIFR